MKLTLPQFEVLVYIERNQNKKHSQKELAKNSGFPMVKINQIIYELLENELIIKKENNIYSVTLKGYEKLEPYRVKKAIFMAAGFGSRMVPITLNIPKPLVLVNGKRMIETLLDAVIEVGIDDITIVRGFLGEQFDVLLSKYPMIKFINNPIYNETNNISSAYMIRDLLDRAYVLESDLILYNKNIIRKYEYSSNYVGIKVDLTDDWCFDTKNGKITNVMIGGKKTIQMVGISFWSKEDSFNLKNDIYKTFHKPGGKEKYWDEVPLKECRNHYKIMVRLAQKDDVIEVDTLNELKKIDSSYNV